jgi:ribosome biogenesis GTPase
LKEVGGLPSGIIIKGIGGFYYVCLPDGIYECKARGRFRKDDITPLPGDKVDILVVNDSKKTGYIEEILPRENVLIRPAIANVDQLIAVIAAVSPQPDLLLLDKLLVTAVRTGIESLLFINKTDIDKTCSYNEIASIYRSAGYNVILGSGITGSGLNELKQSLQGHISVFAGQSGVGKSTIINNLMGATVMLTGEISDRLNRGKHTTRHAELIDLGNNGYNADTPGFSSFELLDIGYNELYQYYDEFLKYMGHCRFTGCSHISEPGCEVKNALETGIVDRGRYQRYVTLYNELKSNRVYNHKPSQ